MTSREINVRLRRRWRRGRRHVEDLGLLAGEQLDRNLINRFGRLLFVRRFVTAWLLLFILLGSGVIAQTEALSYYYQESEPVPGGVFQTGILGDFTNASPLYATTPVDSSVSRLVFSGLLTYNDHNQLVGNLAKSWSVDSTGKIYTVQLKPDLRWQDGKPLTAQDVVFTYHVIQNPDAESPLQSSWQNVTVTAPTPNTVVFTLADPLSSFPYSLTNGIVPQHLLAKIPMAEMRSANFNTEHPVGSGPFAWKMIQVSGNTPATRQEQITLTPSPYYDGARPKLDGLIINAYHDKTKLIQDFLHGQVHTIVGLTEIPPELANDKYLHSYNFPFTGADMVFFKTSTGILADKTVRQALVRAANVNRIIENLGYPAIPVREPLLAGQLGYDPAYQQVTGDPVAAEQLLQQGGWTPGKDGILTKGGQRLSFNLYASDTTESKQVTAQLQKQWRAIGADVQVILQNDSDLQNTVAFHSYDAVLYGISIGVDPDVFAYWDSSQADPRSGTWLNLSEYKSSVADEALEGGRTRFDPSLRAIKYRPFLQAWQTDAPALGLYQPRLLYITDTPIYGLNEHEINSAADRFADVTSWEIRTGKVDD